jgi:hypothetical protein
MHKVITPLPDTVYGMLLNEAERKLSFLIDSIAPLGPDL